MHLCTSAASVLDCRYEITNRLNLLSCDPRTPLNELFDGAAVLKVLGRCPNRQSRFGEDPSAADLGWVPFDCSALVPRVHGSFLTRLRLLEQIHGRSSSDAIVTIRMLAPRQGSFNRSVAREKHWFWKVTSLNPTLFSGRPSPVAEIAEKKDRDGWPGGRPQRL